MTLVAALNIAAYLGGYVVRLNVMSRLAKDADPDVNRRYFFEETFVAAVALVGLPALAALVVPGTIGGELRAGFAGLFTSPLSGPATLIGLLYGVLYMFGTWIYLDPRRTRSASRSIAAPAYFRGSCPRMSWRSYWAAVPRRTRARGCRGRRLRTRHLMLETLNRQRAGRLSPAQRVFLFVCGGNTSRSPMAQAICNAEIARDWG